MDRPGTVTRRTLLALACASTLPVRAQGRPFLLGLLSQADDARYAPQALQEGFPDAPWGRAAPALGMALNDGFVDLRLAGWGEARVLQGMAPDAAGLQAALEQLAEAGVRHLVLELPAAGVAAVTAAATGREMILFNAAAPEDALRGPQCAPHLLHTLPSHAMQMDAIAQWLVARRWLRPLVLPGPLPADALLLAAFERSARRYGLRPVAQAAPEVGDHDAVVVLDTRGAIARDTVYRTVLPLPVLGSNGLVAQAWSPLWDRFGAPELSRRFLRRALRPMGSYDWAAWAAGRAAAEAAGSFNRATPAQQLQALRQGAVGIDGGKGMRLSFRAWDGQLRQPLLLAHGNGVAGVAPLGGFNHHRTPLDTLGHDEADTACKAA